MPFIVQENGILLECSWDLVTSTDPDIALARTVVAALPLRVLAPPTERAHEMWRQYWRGDLYRNFMTPPPLALGVHGDPSDT